MRQNPQKHCVVAMLDIDDFKLVNDMYGHAAGDGALLKLAESMKQYFSKDAILGKSKLRTALYTLTLTVCHAAVLPTHFHLIKCYVCTPHEL